MKKCLSSNFYMDSPAMSWSAEHWTSPPWVPNPIIKAKKNTGRRQWFAQKWNNKQRIAISWGICSTCEYLSGFLLTDWWENQWGYSEKWLGAIWEGVWMRKHYFVPQFKSHSTNWAPHIFLIFLSCYFIKYV